MSSNITSGNLLVKWFFVFFNLLLTLVYNQGRSLGKANARPAALAIFPTGFISPLVRVMIGDIISTWAYVPSGRTPSPKAYHFSRVPSYLDTRQSIPQVLKRCLASSTVSWPAISRSFKRYSRSKASYFPIPRR